MDNFHSVLHLLLNMVPPSVESMSEIVPYSVYFCVHLQVDNFHSVLHLLLNMVPPSVESMSHSSSTSKYKDGNDVFVYT